MFYSLILQQSQEFRRSVFDCEAPIISSHNISLLRSNWNPPVHAGLDLN